MAISIQSTLLEPDGSATTGAVRWIEGLLLGEVALALCVIAVALIGVMMLRGRLPVRDGLRVALGCAVLLGAPVIASGFMAGSSEFRAAPVQPPPLPAQAASPRDPLPPADHDPYAGASLRRE
jgi:type IV secretory pathway VirB2 component (pilin)